ncbi:hypothetical protein BV898_14817 [Hypsibius exemplaris]|uniref:VWFC domain-containing protein n=1 Tax=Hypsibius exemplaris TaxID=2072580 RepID=A0A9X6N9D1_HYPEX|nr:hypothetical protein BV898_14817 [Hypsibius exemplaris]
MARNVVVTLIVMVALSTRFVSCSPVKRSTLEQYLLSTAEKAQSCDVEGEYESTDPCKPFCVCHKGSVVCAEITCTDEYDAPDPKAFCGKVHVTGRCCHHYLCVSDDGTGTMVYPLPIVSAPDELYETRR